jgi:hypothetical protein
MAAQIQQRPGSVTWTHTDSDPRAALAAALTVQSFLTKPDGSPMSSQDRLRLVRSLGVATVYTMEAACSGGVPPAGEMETHLTLGTRPLRASDFPSRGSLYAASAVGRTFMLLADPGHHTVYSATTHDGDPAVLSEASTSFDTAFPPLVLGAVLVVAALVHALAICFVAQKGAEVIDAKLANDARTDQMLATQAQAVALLDQHNERERAAGKPLPWAPNAQKLFDALTETQRDVARQTHSPLPDPFGGAVTKMGEVGGKLADSALGIGGIALGAGALYLLTR